MYAVSVFGKQSSSIPIPSSCFYTCNKQIFTIEVEYQLNQRRRTTTIITIIIISQNLPYSDRLGLKQEIKDNMRQNTFLPGPVALNIALISGNVFSYPWKPMSVVPDGMTCIQTRLLAVMLYIIYTILDILLHVSKSTSF